MVWYVCRIEVRQEIALPRSLSMYLGRQQRWSANNGAIRINKKEAGRAE
jgi:hypothetical protein